MVSIKKIPTYIIFGIFRFDCLERLICRVQGAAEQPDSVVNWTRHLHCLGPAIFTLSSHLVRWISQEVFCSLKELCREYLFKFDGATNESLYCNGNVYNLQTVAPHEFWCLV